MANTILFAPLDSHRGGLHYGTKQRGLGVKCTCCDREADVNYQSADTNHKEIPLCNWCNCRVQSRTLRLMTGEDGVYASEVLTSSDNPVDWRKVK